MNAYTNIRRRGSLRAFSETGQEVKGAMEELRKLETVQRMLTLMQSHGVVTSSDNDSNRFLANLLLFLSQPCGDLNINSKCTLIAQHLPLISASFLREASFSLNDGDGFRPVSVGEEKGGVGKGFEEAAMVGFDAMQRANSTLEDFCRSYFMFHGMDVDRRQSVFKYLPVLSFTESYIYKMDRLNEEIVNVQSSRVTFTDKHRKMELNEGSFAKCDVFKTDPFGPLIDQLKYHGLLTDRIKEEFKQGEEYWALERKLCSALINQLEISVEDVMRAVHLKSFDYRVLNLLLYQLRGEEVNDLHMEFLSISEFLVEVSDDLFDYEDDVVENCFNILRMFVNIYGPLTAPAMLAKYIAEAEEKYESLLKRLDPELSWNYQRRCEEATKEGGKTCGHPFGTWSIPAVIVDEELYRSKWSDDNQSSAAI